MRTFATYEEENIHYWTHRASGYSAVNQEELATAKEQLGGEEAYETYLKSMCARMRSGCWTWAPGRAFLPSFWRSWAIR